MTEGQILVTRPDRLDLIRAAATALGLGTRVLFPKNDSLDTGSLSGTALAEARRATVIQAVRARKVPALLSSAGYDTETVRDSEHSSLCDEFGIRFVGQNTATARLCVDKGKTKEVLEARGLRVAGGRVHRNAESLCDALRDADEPSYLKPAVGASGEFHRVVRPGEPFDPAGLPFPVLREPLLSGIEVSVDVLSRPGGELVYPPIHKGRLGITPEHPRSKLKVCPYPWSAAEHTSLIRTAVAAARAVGSSAVANVDLVLHDDGTVTVLEVNARFSGSTRMLQAATDANPYELLLSGVLRGHRASGEIRARRTVFEYPCFRVPDRVPDFAAFTPTTPRHCWIGTASVAADASVSKARLTEFLDGCGAARFREDILAIVRHDSEGQ